MIAFEFSKRRYERISKYHWGSWYEKISYTGKVLEYRNAISDICDEVSQRISENPDERYLLSDYLAYIERVSNEILVFCNTREQELEKDKKYSAKYFNVDFGIQERLFIFVSGQPDTGKTVFSNILSYRIKNSIHLDSDILLERNQLCLPLADLIRDDIKVVIFSDIYADRFFSQEELGNARVVNILMKPISVEAMHRNSKFMSHIPLEDYKRNEIDKIRYDSLKSPIIVINNYKGQMSAEADSVLEEIASRLGTILSPRESSSNKSKQNISTLKRVLKPTDLKSEATNEEEKKK